jgi:glycerate kinase
MHILCAPDSFKETLGATAVAGAMAEGVRRGSRGGEADRCPIGDGGEGSLDALVLALGAEIVSVAAHGPLGEALEARLGLVRGRGLAIVELAQASGLALVPPAARDPMRASTFGTGEVIRHALDLGCVTVLVCLGGSATVDGGSGLAQALGARFRDRHDHPIEEPLCGGRLLEIGRVERPSCLPRLVVACDVVNPLCGPRGAAAVYGPQKGATPGQVRALEAGLAHLAAIAGDRGERPGDGAAGGAGFGLRVILGAELRRGIDLVLETVGFAERCRRSDLVLTGEGRLDAQSLEGKAIMGVAQAARRWSVPTIAIVGDTGPGAERCLRSHGGFLERAVSLSERFGRDRAMTETAALIEGVARELTS